MQTRGWDSHVDPSDSRGVVEPEVPGDQRAAWEADKQGCISQVGVALPPNNETNAKIMYSWLVKQKGCLEGLGFTISQPPTEQTFVADYLADQKYWNPFTELAINSDSQADQVNTQCPQTPPEFSG